MTGYDYALIEISTFGKINLYLEFIVNIFQALALILIGLRLMPSLLHRETITCRSIRRVFISGFWPRLTARFYLMFSKETKLIRLYVPAPYHIVGPDGKYFSIDGNPMYYDFQECEKDTMCILDANGIAQLTQLIGRIPELRLEIRPFTMHEEDKILDEIQQSGIASVTFGSSSVNCITRWALKDIHPRFADYMDSGNKARQEIIGREGKQYLEETANDYAIIVKRRKKEMFPGFLLIFAGIGPSGTFGAIMHFLNNLNRLDKSFRDRDYIMALKINRSSPTRESVELPGEQASLPQ